MVKRLLCMLLICLITAACFAVSAAQAEDFLIEEDEENMPDPLQQARILMRWMTDEEKIGQMIMVSPEDLTGEARTVRLMETGAFEKLPAGGVIIYGQNIETDAQLKALIQEIRNSAHDAGLYMPFIAVDEEGGTVARVAHKLGGVYVPSAEETGKTKDAQQAYRNGKVIGEYLHTFGFNLDLAPVADVMISTAPELESRSFGEDAEVVSDMALEMAKGLREEGIIPCFKHFPGHGAVSRNAHNVPVSHGRTLAEMQVLDFVPFAAAIENGAEMIMMSHLKALNVDREHPASLSYVLVTEILRNALHFEGVVICDALRMDAIREEYSIEKAAVLAVNAGVDILLAPDDGQRVYQALQKAMENGTVSRERIDESVARILALKIKNGLIQ
mgnify:FL=1